MNKIISGGAAGTGGEAGQREEADRREEAGRRASALRAGVASAARIVGEHGEAGAEPVACSLSAEDLAGRADRWVALAGRALTSRTETADGVRLTFRAGPGVESELRALAAAENECCSWADWAVQATAGVCVFTVQAAGHGVATLHEMFRTTASE